MASYKLYAAVLAFACIASLHQEISCGSSKVQPVESEQEVLDEDVAENEVYGEEEEDQEYQGQDELQSDCDEYNFKIWNDTFGDPNATALAHLTLDTIKEMSANEVCSDTIRHVLKTAETLVTSQHAHYSARMLSKLMWSISKKTDTKSDKYKETSKAIRRVMTDPRVQGLISNFITRGVNLLKDPVVRTRMATMSDSLTFMFKPYLDKAVAKNQMNQNKRTVSIK